MWNDSVSLSLETPLLRSVPIFNWDIWFVDNLIFWLFTFLCSLYILYISPLSSVELMMVFSHSIGSQFVLLIVSLPYKNFSVS